MILEGIQQVELVNQSIDWYNFWLSAGATCLSVFLGAILAHLSAWYINKRQFEKNMTIEKDNQDRLSNLEYWKEVYMEIRVSLKATMDFKKECKRIVDDTVVEFKVISSKELADKKNNLFKIHTDLVLVQCDLQFLMYRIKDNNCFENEYKMYKSQSKMLYSDINKIFGCAFEVLKEIENFKKADNKNKEETKIIEKDREFQEINISESISLTNKLIVEVTKKINLYS